MERKGKWTPGLWVDDGHDGKHTIIVNSKWGEVARVAYIGCYKQQHANARLVAAAPELADALEHAVNWGIGFAKKTGERPTWLDSAIAALMAAGVEV